jgi:hypothetical protein
VRRFFLVLMAIIGSWYAMEAVHELGHVIGARGEVIAVQIPIIGISSTTYASDMPPTSAIFAGPLFGAVVPCLLLLKPRTGTWFSRTLRFFVGFCLVANGVYLAAGTGLDAGDAADLLQHGVSIVTLIVVGVVLVLLGLGVWHRNGRWCGLAPDHV